MEDMPYGDELHHPQYKLEQRNIRMGMMMSDGNNNNDDMSTMHPSPPAQMMQAPLQFPTPDGTPGKRKERAPSSTSFPVKLYKILNDPKYREYIAWLPHGRAWRILKPKSFEEDVIPKHFRSERYASFMRQVCYCIYAHCLAFKELMLTPLFLIFVCLPLGKRLGLQAYHRGTRSERLLPRNVSARFAKGCGQDATTTKGGDHGSKRARTASRLLQDQSVCSASGIGGRQTSRQGV